MKKLITKPVIILGLIFLSLSVWNLFGCGQLANTTTSSNSVGVSASDIAAPANPSITINSGDTSTTTTSATLTLSATDATGVTGYYISETGATPSAAV